MSSNVRTMVSPSTGKTQPPPRGRMRRAVALSALALLGVCAVLAFCLYHGFLQCNYPSLQRYPVRGVDVSHHQGVIDWPALAGQGMRFAYIKATEGGDFKDKRFAENWRQARAAGLAAGAYHFFRAGKTGREQAENFIATVPKEADALPPVLDVECPVVPPGPERDRIRAAIRDCLLRLEAHYGKKPVVYVTYEAYEPYFSGIEGKYPLWIRSVFTAPDTPFLGRDWQLWQYSARGRLRGYSGPERFIDLNAFNGTAAEFERFRAGTGELP